MACNKGTVQLVISNCRMAPGSTIRSLWSFSFESDPTLAPGEDPDLLNAVLGGWAVATVGSHLSTRRLSLLEGAWLRLSDWTESNCLLSVPSSKPFLLQETSISDSMLTSSWFLAYTGLIFSLLCLMTPSNCWVTQNTFS